MIVYFLFKLKNDDYICSYIYNEENSKIFSYSFDEDYIVKSDEPNYKKLEELETALLKKSKSKKAKDTPVILEKKDFPDIKNALFFLEGSLDDFKEGIQARKKLPQIINPYDLDFEEGEEFGSLKEEDLESGVGEESLFEDFKDLPDDEDDAAETFDDDDDLYR